MAYTKTTGLVTTGLTASTTLATHVAGIETAVVAARNPGNQLRVDAILSHLRDLADLLREAHL